MVNLGRGFCYVLLPFFLPALVRLTWKQQKLVAAAYVVLAALPSLSAKLIEAPAAGVFYSMPIFRLLEFVPGCCVCLAWADDRIKSLSNAAEIAIVGGFVATLGVAGPLLPLYVRHNWIAIPVLAIMTLCLAYDRGIFAALLSNRLVVWLGKVSYSFYSFQVLLILLLIKHYDQAVRHYPILANNWVLTGIGLVALLALAAAGHHLIEEPARRWIKRRAAAGPQRVTARLVQQP